jgi:hypothetical protein
MNLIKKGSLLRVQITITIDWRFVAVPGTVILAWLLIR